MSVKDAVWNTDHDEAVEVNQRALIDKVLARYSGDFSVVRELLQNSDDAQAKAVEIRFDTPKGEGAFVDASTGRMKPHGEILIDCWTLKNDGGLFRSEDWDRLRKIAEGNPDEQKIGAFGVGFYTVFSVTNQPSVTSGGNCMEFYWKEHKDQLFVRSGTLNEESPSKWTTFRLPLQEPSAMPVPFDLIRFLSSSIAFMASIQTVSLFLNDICLAKLVKETKPSESMSLPKGLSPRTKRGTMVVTGVNIIPIQIHADVLDWVQLSLAEEGSRAIEAKDSRSFGPSASVQHSASKSSVSHCADKQPIPFDNGRTATSIRLSVFSADVSVKLGGKVLGGIRRCTKKNPPAEMRYDLVYSSYDEYIQGTIKDTQRLDRWLFQDLRADLKGQGTARVIIGHATSQTTGIGGHMAARFIPTAEREAIDFAAEHVSVWNKALLEVGGILSRVAYEYEFAGIEKRWDEAAQISATLESTKAVRDSLVKYALHALKFFTFHRSTPRPLFSKGIMEAFFNCLPEFPILSTRGVKSSFNVCLPEPALAGFLKDLPVLPEGIATGATDMVEILKKRNYINHSVPDDLIIEQLAQAPLKEQEMVACLQWWVSVVKDPHLKQGDKEKLKGFQERLLSVAVLNLDVAANRTTPFALALMKEFVPNTSFIPTDGPLPESVLPSPISRAFAPEDLVSIFHWTELSIEQWVAHISSGSVVGTPGLEPFDISLDTQWATRVLTVVNRSWLTLTEGAREAICNALSGIACIPTTIGMKKPEHAYLSNVSLPDLPMALGLVGMDELLRSLGLKSRVALDIIFDKLFNTKQWTTAVVAKYLASVRSTLTDEEMERLRSARVFRQEPRTADVFRMSGARFVVSELHEPSDLCRKLELPVLHWDQSLKWDSQSNEAELLREIGLQRSPKIDALIHGCASADVTVRRPALDYLLKNISSTYSDYRPENFAAIPFLPAIRNKQPIMGTPRDVVITEHWGEIGFDVLDRGYLIYASALKVQNHPGPDEIIDLLRTRPPLLDEEAAKIFSLMSPHTLDFTDDHRQTLSTLSFLPVSSACTGVHLSSHLPPSECYLGNSSHPVYSQIFAFVDFGQAAKPFLVFCGVKEEPSTDEIANALARYPRRFYKLCRGADGYLSELRKLAMKSAALSDQTIARMTLSPFLLAIRQENKTGSKDEGITTYHLKAATQIIVVDDIACYRLFKFEKELFTAPQEDVLERFYFHLGSRKLSKSVQSKCHTSGEIINSEEADAIRNLVLERLPLFLHENTLAKPTLAAQWDRKFVVRAFQTLEITKTLQIGSNITKPWPSKRAAKSAAAIRINEILELRICTKAAVDFYEVAQSINTLVLKAPKTNDDLLLSTILSTDITMLERRGYNVAKILKQQQSAVDGQVVQAAPSVKSLPRSMRQAGSAANPNSRVQLYAQASSSLDALLSRMAEPAQVFTGSHPSAVSPDGLHSSPPSTAAGMPADGHIGSFPEDLVASTIALAIKAYSSGSLNLLRKHEYPKPPASELYCDASGSYDLRLLGLVENVRVFTHQDASPSVTNAFIIGNNQALVRFVRILLHLSSIFQLPQGSIHIVDDPNEELAAFNRDAQIFLNFRYFQHHHDAQVKKSELDFAYTAWYFALAHEIAHNIVEAHNAEHEFYFTAICEAHVAGLVELLSL
ncbi:hypothetical protein BKA70DRAFT_1266286 [Coprinopsis sp. MPI-PUGE-AT-0042]|nr:hypothetical protein BKA70DRAFT_1266286 [Coprinopsis sp. MPI-PUGE-AT-0042]